ncbi:hypothetical protein SAM19_04084 [Brevibacillus laterosporus]|nr:hypothetical protein [Brevibacillus laterosporus]
MNKKAICPLFYESGFFVCNFTASSDFSMMDEVHHEEEENNVRYIGSKSR